MKNLFGMKPEVSKALEAQYVERLQFGDRARGERSIQMIRARLQELRKRSQLAASVSTEIECKEQC